MGVSAGDASLAAPVEFTCGTVHITVADPLAVQAASSRAQKLSESRQEIQYQYRPAEKRPNALIALIAAGAAIAPLVFFLKEVLAGVLIVLTA